MPSIARPRRSVLYLPASNARAVEKSRTLACDVVILDLEDAVAPDAKIEARAGAVAAAKAGGYGERELVIRVNGLDTPWGADDLAAVAAAKPDAVLVPKISAPADLEAARAALGPDVRLWAMIETCAAMFALNEIGAASVRTGVDVWVIGSNDLAKEMRCALTVDREPLMTALTMSLMAARAHGLSILDGVYNDIADADGLARQCGQAVAWGFDGKTLIHPSQVGARQRGLHARPGRGGLGPNDHRGLRTAGDRRQGRDQGRGPDGRAAAPGAGPAADRGRRGHRPADAGVTSAARWAALALLAAGPAVAQTPSDAIDDLLRQPTIEPATTAPGTGPQPYAPPPRRSTLTAPVHVDETGRNPDGPPTAADAAYDGRLRSSMASAQAYQGPMDGGWTLLAGGRELYVFQLTDRAGVVDGAWRDLRRPGALDASGFFDQVERSEAGLRFWIGERVVVPAQ